MIVYKVTNIINGKSYIGITIFELNKRKWVHLNNMKAPKQTFHKALVKYGKRKNRIYRQCET